MRLAFIGSKELGLTALRALLANESVTVVQVISFDDSTDSRSKLSEFKETSAAAGLDCALLNTETLAAVNHSLAALLEHSRPDIIFALGWYWKITVEVLSMARIGFYGIHAGDLPRYKGSSPIVWAMLQGEENIGVSFFRFANELDKGEVYAKRYINSKDRYIAEVLNDIQACLPELLRKGIENVAARKYVTDLPDDDYLYYLQRTDEDGKIQWLQPAVQIVRLIRALSKPYGGAWFAYEGAKIRVFKAELVESKYRFVGAPGTVHYVGRNFVKVLAGDGRTMRLEQLELLDAQVETFDFSRLKAKGTRL